MLGRALAWLGSGRRVAVVAVTAVSGGAFPPPGSLMVVAEGGETAGSVSGGRIDGSVAEQAERAIADGECRLLAYTVPDEGVGEGGRIELFVDAVDPGSGAHRLLGRIAAAAAEGRPVALVMDLLTGLRTLVYPHAVHGGFGVDEPDLTDVRRLLSEGRSAVIDVGEEGRLLVLAFAPAG